MIKKVTSLLFVGLLSMVSGCSKTQQQVSAGSAPAAEAVKVAPTPPALPPVRGHWTITFKRLLTKKNNSSSVSNYSFVPNTGKIIGVLNVDLNYGVSEIDNNQVRCTQNGLHNQYGFNNPNILMLKDDNGKPKEDCFTSVGSFDGSSGQLSHTAVVLVVADNAMKQQSWREMAGETEKVPPSTMGRPVRLAIQCDGDSKLLWFDAAAALAGDMISGEWYDSHNEQYGGTFFGQRTRD